MRYAFLLLLAPALVLLAACGGDDDGAGTSATATAATSPSPGGSATEPAPTGTPAISACALVTAEEAAEALGGPVDAPAESILGESLSQCVFKTVGGTELDPILIMQVRTDIIEADFERFVTINSPGDAGEVVVVPGLGDRAYQQVATFVYSGGVIIVVRTTTAGVAGDPAVQQDLARKALARLP